MLRGRVSPHEQPVITVDIHGNGGRSESVEAVIDTGFSRITMDAAADGKITIEELAPSP